MGKSQGSLKEMKRIFLKKHLEDYLVYEIWN